MCRITFKVDVWGFKVIFYGDVERANKETRLELHEISTFTYTNKSEILIVVDGCKFKTPSKENLRYLVHETNHAAMRMLDRVGVTVNIDNQEALCYTQDFIFSEILKGLLKLNSN